MSIKRVSGIQAEDCIANRAEFDASRLTGRWHRPSELERHPGRLDVDAEGDWLAALTAAGPVYVVWSYATPIAWMADGRVFVPDVGYSVSTSRHQCRAARGFGVTLRTCSGRR